MPDMTDARNRMVDVQIARRAAGLKLAQDRAPHHAAMACDIDATVFSLTRLMHARASTVQKKTPKKLSK